MTEKERAAEFLRQHHISGADFTYTTGFDNMVRLLEAYAAQQKSEIPTDDRIMQYVTSRFSDSHLKPELIAFRAIKYYIAGLPPVSENRCVLDGQKSEIKMPPKEAIVQYFNNHSNCYTDVIIGDTEFTEPAMTVDEVLKLVEWLRNQIEK